MPASGWWNVPPFRLGGITDRTTEFEHETDVEVRRNRTYEILDEAPFQKWVLFVAGAGFLTDAYDIFAVNTVLPMVSFVYWDGEFQIPQRTYTALLCATLAGSIVGQLVFGFLGDCFGRKRMYGLLLLLIIWGTLGLAATADGSHGSMNIVGWFFLWRFVMGVGIGGDYPLSAAITSEFAPKKHRPAMLATLFFMQPVGQFIATVVAIIVTYLYRNQMQDENYCQSPECFRAVDRAWRWIIGIGGIPALIAFIIRLQIPESPRFTMDVLLNSRKALADTKDYFQVGGEMLPMQELKEHQNGGIAPKDLGIGSPTEAAVAIRRRTQTGADSLQNGSVHALPDVSISPKLATKSPHKTRTFSADLNASHTADGSYGTPRKRQKRERIREWRKGFSQYFGSEGNWPHLVGVCATWFLLDVSFYGLGMSSPTIIQEIWSGPDPLKGKTVYALLFGNAWHPSIVVSLAALVGGLCMIYAVRHSRLILIQSVFFIVLGLFLELVGSTFKPFLDSRNEQHWALVVFYFCCQLFFQLGPNATTYIIPSEQFPTPYRCTCIGLAAASGKLGSVVVQLGLGLTGATTVSHTTIRIPLWIFGALMFLGALLTQCLVPDSRDADGNPMSLEDLAKGVQLMQDLRSPGRWWTRWHSRPQIISSTGGNDIMPTTAPPSPLQHHHRSSTTFTASGGPNFGNFQQQQQ